MKRFALASVVLAAAGLWLWATHRPTLRSPDPIREELPAKPGNSSAPADTVLAQTARPASEERPVDLPVSLRGTEVDGWLTVVDGRFVPDRHAIRLFDYFLSTYGEVDSERIEEMVAQEALRQVPANQVAAVMELFDRYLRFREHAAVLARGARTRSYFDDLQTLQQELFGADADSVFGWGNRLIEHTLRRREIMADPELGEADRAEKLEALDADLPPDLRSARRQMARHQEVVEVVAQMRDDGLSEAEIFDYRADEFGEEAAQRLAALDGERAEWQRRLDAYRSARESVLAQGLDPANEAEALERLRQERFDARELVRVRGIDASEAPKKR